MMGTEQRSELEKDLEALSEAVGHATDDLAAAFVHKHPLSTLFGVLSQPDMDLATLQTASAALAKLFDTSAGQTLLPEVQPYAAAALQSAGAPPGLRRLAAQQLCRLLRASGAGAHQQQQVVELLLQQGMRDASVGVALEAEHGLLQLAAAGGAEAAAWLAAHPALQELAAADDPTLRARALALLVGVAGQSPEASAAVQNGGDGSTSRLEALVRELSQPDDLLSCMAALQLVAAAAGQCDPAAAAPLAQLALPPITALLSPQQDPLLRCGALQAAAAVLAAALEAGVAVAAAQPLLAALKGALDVRGGEEVPAEVEEAALDAVGTLGLQPAGAQALLLWQPTTQPGSGSSGSGSSSNVGGIIGDVAYRALGRAASPRQREVALHALAAVAGSERAAGAARADALLPAAAEDALRAAVYAGASEAAGGSQAATPVAAAFLAVLEQPFLEQRVGAYRALAPLLLREWAAGETCAHADLLNRLLSPRSESSRQGCEWRHACVVALAATLNAVLSGGGSGGGGGNAGALVGNGHSANGVIPFHARMAAAQQAVAEAVRQGPFGAGMAAAPVHFVATASGQ